MALTPFRWIAAAVVAMAIVFIAMLQDNGPEQRPEDVEFSRLVGVAADARYRASLQAAQFRMLELVDSTRSRATRADTATIRVFIDRSIPAAVRPALDSALARARARLDGGTRMGVDVSVVNDTARLIHGFLRFTSEISATYALPRSSTERCGVVLRLGRARQAELQRVLATEAAGEQLLGPCAYYAAFGMPGEDIARWLRKQGAFLAFGGSWTRSPEPPPSRDRRRWYFDASHPALDFLTPRGAACSVGDTLACLAAANTGVPAGRMLVAGSSVTIHRFGPVLRDYTDFGPRQTEVLAGMVRTLGRERFGQFWRSEQPLPEAFERASGVSLGAWLSNWLAEQYGRPPRGPSVSAIGLIGAILFTVLGIVLGLRMAARREFE